MSSTSRAPAFKPDLIWIDAENGYRLALDDGKLVCRNGKGPPLASVPKAIKDGPTAEQLTMLRDWLEMHARDCREQVETWMLRSLPVPRAVVASLWEDPAWRSALENAVVQPVDASGRPDPDNAGLLKSVYPARGAGIIDLDGESRWLDAPAIAFPHPILLNDLQDFRTLLIELELSQGIAQLLREVFTRNSRKDRRFDPDDTSVDDFSGGEFEELNHLLGLCRKLGYRVRGGYAICRVWEGGHVIEARHWIGSEDPEYETETGELIWVDGLERTLALRDVGPVAWSEGMRMAASLYAARVIAKEESDV